MTDQERKIAALAARVEELERAVAELEERLNGMHELTGEEKGLLKFLKEVDPLMLRCRIIEDRLDKAGL